MNKMKMMFLAFITALGMTLAVVTPANAATSGLCWVNGNQNARLSVSKWVLYYDSVGNPRYRYHLDMNTGGMFIDGLYFRGVKQSGYNDVYVDTWATSSTVSGIWYNFTNGEEKQTFKCSVVV